jgi:hypothetical protein
MAIGWKKPQAASAANITLYLHKTTGGQQLSRNAIDPACEGGAHAVELARKGQVAAPGP